MRRHGGGGDGQVTSVQDRDPVSGFAVEQRNNDEDHERENERDKEAESTAEGPVTRGSTRSMTPGEPIDPRIRAPVESRLGVSLRDARVHTDRSANAAANDLGARAFAHGSDVYLGANERSTDQQLMAHELVHVAQQQASTRSVQRKAEVGAGDSPAEKQADTVADQVTAAMIVEASPGSGQQTKAAFMAELERQVTAAASSELGPLWSAAGCPYITAFFSRHRKSDAIQVEKLAQRYSGVKKPATAQEYMAPIVARVTSGVRKWRAGSDVSDHLRLVGMESESKAANETGKRSQSLEKADGKIHRKAKPGAPTSAASTPAPAAQAIDPGSRLQASALHRMNRAFGRDFSGVRVHSGPNAARESASINARAFTVGNQVSFGAGEYRPGTMHGDALLAHELAHVAQQNGSQVPWSERAAPTKPGKSSPGFEADADSAATTALTRLYGPPQAGNTGRIAVKPSGGLRIQRCVNTPTGLTAVKENGAWEGKQVGTHDRTTNSAFGRRVNKFPIIAGDTLGFVDTESAAIALATAGGISGGAVTLEGGKYVAYKTLVPNTNYTEEGHTIAPGVLALIDDRGTVKRRNKAGDTVADAAGPKADPLAAYREQFGTADGGKLNRSDNEILRVFSVALRANALNALAQSEHEVRARQKHLGGGNKTVTDGEIAHIRSTIGKLHPLAEQTEATRSAKKAAKRKRYNTTPADQYQMVLIGGASMRQPPNMTESEEEKQLAKKIQDLQRQTGLLHAQYPILGRFQSVSSLAALMNIKDDNTLLARLGSEMPEILKSIKATRLNVQKEQLDLWQIPSLFTATIAGLNIQDADQRKVIEDHQKSLAKSDMITDIVLGVFAIGLSIGAIFATGGLALALGAGALGLGVFDAVRMTNKYLVEGDASNTAEDKAKSLLSPDDAMHWGWLAVAWAGVVLDVFDVAAAASKVVAPAVKGVAKGQKIEDAARALAKTMSDDPVEIAAHTTRLRNAAGDFPPLTKIGFDNKAALELRIGTAIEIADDIPKDAVRVMYQIDDLGNVTVTGCKVGRGASTADIALHAGVVRQLRRYDGVLGQIRQLWDKMRSLVGAGGQGSLKPGSEAWESFMELSKHEKILAARKSRLGAGGLTAADEAALKADVDFFANELAHHRKIVQQMSEEAGQGFVASSGVTTRAALKKGIPLPDPSSTTGAALAVPSGAGKMAKIDKMILDSPYYYRLQGGEYVLVKKASSTGPSLRWDDVAKKFVEGSPTRTEKAAAILASMGQTDREAFDILKAVLHKTGDKLVPLQGIKQLNKKMGEIITTTAGTDFKPKFLAILVEAHTDAGVPAAKAAEMAQKSLDDFLGHSVTVVQGTGQLRAFGYASNFAKKTGSTVDAGVDLHHLIPLYLGGNHVIKNFAKLTHGPHTKMHDLINSLKIDDAISGATGVTLSPGKIQNLDGFSTGAAVLKTDGSIEFLSLPEVATRAAAAKAAAATPTPPTPAP